MTTRNRETVRYAWRLVIMVVVLWWVLTGPGVVEGEGNVCNSEVVKYLKTAGFSAEDVRRICSEARISAEAYQEESNKCEALARQIELVWEERHPSEAMDIMVMKHAVDLICPRVCDVNVVKYLKSVGISPQSIREICVLAETLVAREALGKGDALKKALREKSTAIYQINDHVIREAARLLRGEKEQF